MPIYEFFCADCHTIFNFFSRTVNTSKWPACPRCGKPRLERKVSTFAISKGTSEPADGALADLDESRMESAMAALAREADGLDEDNPRQTAQMMRKIYSAAGMKMTGSIEEAIRRMESGEDPDKIEEEMGDLLENESEDENPFLEEGGGSLKRLHRKLRPPAVDETLYEL